MRAGTRAGLSSRSRAPRRSPLALPGRCCSAGRRAGWPRPQVRARCRSRPRSAGRGAADRCSALCGGGPARGLLPEARQLREDRRGRREERGDRRNDRDYFPDRRGRPVHELAGARDGVGRWRWGRRSRRRWVEAGAEAEVEWDRFLGRARRAPDRSGQALVSPAGRPRRRHRPACLPRCRQRSPQECFRRDVFGSVPPFFPGAFRSPSARSFSPAGALSSPSA